VTAAGFASDELAETIQALPGLRIVIEHLGSVSRRDLDETQQPAAARSLGWPLPEYLHQGYRSGRVSANARCPSPAVPLRPAHSHRCSRKPIAAFGPSRMMWGFRFSASRWPRRISGGVESHPATSSPPKARPIAN